MKNKIIVIAEAGVNHNGSLKNAFEMIDVAKSAGADFIKFQSFIADNLASKFARNAKYQDRNLKTKKTQYQMLKDLEIDKSFHLKIARECERKGISFLSTAFDPESLDFLLDTFDFDFLKIPSGEITNAPFVLKHALSGKNIVLSTGMANMKEIRDALGVLAFGFSKNNHKPSMANFKKSYESKKGKKLLQQKVTLLHCTTEYPAPLSDVNLKAMRTLEKEFKINVGYSDHTSGIAVAIAASGMGAKIIEKHFTLDKNQSGPDHKASLEPNELRDMISNIRLVESILGDGEKKAQQSETKNIEVARKSLVAQKVIRKGEKFSKDNLGIKRPGNGISPYEYWNLIGKISTNDYEKDELIKPS